MSTCRFEADAAQHQHKRIHMKLSSVLQEAMKVPSTEPSEYVEYPPPPPPSQHGTSHRLLWAYADVEQRMQLLDKLQEAKDLTLLSLRGAVHTNRVGFLSQVLLML